MNTWLRLKQWLDPLKRRERARVGRSAAKTVVRERESCRASLGPEREAASPSDRTLALQVAELLAKAAEAGKVGDWLTAVGWCRLATETVQHRGAQSPEVLAVEFAMYLNNLAAVRVTEANELLRYVTWRSRAPEMPASDWPERQSSEATVADRCAVCGRERNTRAREPIIPISHQRWILRSRLDALIPFNLPQLPDPVLLSQILVAGNARLCELCYQKWDDVDKAIRCLRSAEEDLEKAAKLNPSDETIGSNVSRARTWLAGLQQLSGDGATV